jgi:hypothetical protein
MSHIREIAVATPIYGGATADFCQMLVRVSVHFILHQTKVHVLQTDGYSFLPVARDSLVAKTLATPADAVLFVDADMAVDPDVVQRMLDSGHDYVSVCATKRGAPEQLAIDLDHSATEVDGCIEVPIAGVACTLVRRHVLERMIEAYPELRYSIPTVGERHALFLPFIDDGEYFGEDRAFSRRWARLGCPQHVLVDATVSHAKQVFNLRRHLNAARFVDGEHQGVAQ